MHTRATIAAALVALASALPLNAAPPTDDQITALIDKVKAVPPPTARTQAAVVAANKARADAFHEGIKDLSLVEATLPQIVRLADANVGPNMTEASAILQPRLAELAMAPGADGARAAELRLIFFTPYTPPPPGSPAEVVNNAAAAWFDSLRPCIKAALAHPGALESVKAGHGEVAFGRVGSLPTAAIKAGKLIDDLQPLLVPEMSLECAASLGGLLVRMNEPDFALDKAVKVKLLDRIAAAVDGPLARPLPADKPRLIEAARNVSLKAKSAFMRGELIGGPMPAIPFSWSSDPALKSLADLKGSVIIVSFWGTTFEPSNFPLLRAMDARYRQAGSPVRIVGVTSLQGVHFKRKPEQAGRPERVDCRTEPAKEYALMPEFMADMNMTWTVAFTPDGCYNPNFGVIGIPHIAVIDAAGKVRYNEERPYSIADNKAFSDKVDALLKEAGLKVPEQPLPEIAPPPRPTPTPAPTSPPPAAPAAPAQGTTPPPGAATPPSAPTPQAPAPK
jgi:hypothetical protein